MDNEHNEQEKPSFKRFMKAVLISLCFFVAFFLLLFFALYLSQQETLKNVGSEGKVTYIVSGSGNEATNSGSAEDRWKANTASPIKPVNPKGGGG